MLSPARAITAWSNTPGAPGSGPQLPAVCHILSRVVLVHIFIVPPPGRDANVNKYSPSSNALLVTP